MLLKNEVSPISKCKVSDQELSNFHIIVEYSKLIFSMYWNPIFLISEAYVTISVYLRKGQQIMIIWNISICSFSKLVWLHWNYSFGYFRLTISIGMIMLLEVISFQIIALILNSHWIQWLYGNKYEYRLVRKCQT